MGNLVQKLKNMWIPPEDEYEDEDYGYEESRAESQDVDTNDSNERRSAIRRPGAYPKNKVVNINTTAQLQVVLFKPESFGEETRTIAYELLKTHTIVLNLENTSKEVSRRIVDFLSGVTYAISGKIKRIATCTFIITPYNVDLTGDDLLDELENSGVYF